jgi:hypothetical protein
MPRVALPDSLQLCRISGCLYTPYVQNQHHFASFIIDFEDHRKLLHSTHLSRFCWVSSDTGHPRLEASLRSARLQGLLEVGPVRLLAAMLGDLGVSSLRSIRTMTQFSSFEHQTNHVVCFNARGLLYKCLFDTLLFSSSYRPVGKSVSHHVATRPIFSSLLFWIIIPAFLPATMLRYYSMSASSMPSEFFYRRFDLLEACFL